MQHVLQLLIGNIASRLGKWTKSICQIKPILTSYSDSVFSSVAMHAFFGSTHKYRTDAGNCQIIGFTTELSSITVQLASTMNWLYWIKLLAEK